MRIVVISSLASIATANYLIRALRQAGHQLLVVSDVRSRDVDVLAQGTPDIAALCASRGFVPAFAWFVEGGTMALLPSGLERLQCATAWYGIDTHMNYERHAILGRLFDVSFVAQKQYVEPLRRDGLRSVQWLPLAFPADYLDASKEERPLDVAFVGSLDRKMHPDRVRLLEIAASAVSTSEIGPAPPDEMFGRYGRAKMVVNRSINNDINMRYFEAMGAGAVLITDPVRDNGVEDLFDRDSYLVYRNDDQLKQALHSVLKHPERARRMACIARMRVIERHTYEHRAAQLVAMMENEAKRVRPTSTDYFASLVSLGLLDGALWAAASSVGAIRRGGPRAILSTICAAVLRALAAATAFAMRISALRRR